MTTESRKTQELVKAGAETGNAALAEFLGRFDMAIEPTPENVRMVTEQIQVIDRMHAAMEEVTVIERGKRFLWLKAGLKHGQFLDHLRTHFPSLPKRTIQWWMAEARYVMEHGVRQKRSAALLLTQGAAHFAEGDGEELDADDLADPSKPAPLPRLELENRLQRLEKRLFARDRREEKLLEQIASLENRLREERQRKDPDGQDERTPIKTALNRALLALGRALVLLDEAEAQGKRIAADCPPLVLATVTSQLKTKADRLGEFCGREVLAYAKGHNEEKRRREAEGAGGAGEKKPEKKTGGGATTN